MCTCQPGAVWQGRLGQLSDNCCVGCGMWTPFVPLSAAFCLWSADTMIFVRTDNFRTLAAVVQNLPTTKEACGDGRCKICCWISYASGPTGSFLKWHAANSRLTSYHDLRNLLSAGAAWHVDNLEHAAWFYWCDTPGVETAKRYVPFKLPSVGGGAFRLAIRLVKSSC